MHEGRSTPPLEGLKGAPLADPVASMPPLDERARTTLRSLGIDPDNFVAESDGTVYSVLDQSSEAPELPHLGADELKRVGQLGRGGQGVVERAEQAALRREVAVKRATGRAGTRAASTRALIHEARVTGHLEHPNIVPVHALGLDDNGDVVLVMKRIEGESWEQRLKRETAPDVDANLRVLLEVANAVAFAHSRGILHRDLKPSNVMLGGHSEVYVLDWGLAVAVDDTAPAEVPPQTVTDRVTGTPAYMPPEMATPGSAIGRTSDVYLLGGMLYRVVANRPPHPSDDVVHAVLEAQKGALPPLPEGIDDELRLLLERALAPDPADRFQTVEAFVAAVEGYQSHAFARRLTEQALARAAQLEALPRSVATGDDAVEGGRNDREAARLFFEARFGFEQALEEAPGYRPAREGRRAALVSMVERELDRGRVDGAALLAEELDEVPTALAARLKAASAEQHELAEKVEELKKAADVSLGQNMRALTAVLYGVAWLTMQIVVGVLARRALFVPSASGFALTHVLFLGGMLAMVFAYRKEAALNSVSRYMVWLASLTLLALVFFWLVMDALGIDVPTGLAIAHVLIFAAFGSISALDWRWSVAALLALLASPLILHWPQWAYEINGVAIGGGFMALGVLTKRRPLSTD